MILESLMKPPAVKLRILQMLVLPLCLLGCIFGCLFVCLWRVASVVSNLSSIEHVRAHLYCNEEKFSLQSLQWEECLAVLKSAYGFWSYTVDLETPANYGSYYISPDLLAEGNPFASIFSKIKEWGGGGLHYDWRKSVTVQYSTSYKEITKL